MGGTANRLLEEALREAERNMDNQVSQAEVLDRRMDQTLRFGVYVGAGVIALAGMVADKSPTRLDGVVGVVALLGASIHALALLMLVYAQVGAGGGILFAPATAWLAEKMATSGWGTKAHFRSLILSMAEYEAENANRIVANARRLRWSARTLALAVAAYVVASILIVV